MFILAFNFYLAYIRTIVTGVGDNSVYTVTRQIIVRLVLKVNGRTRKRPNVWSRRYIPHTHTNTHTHTHTECRCRKSTGSAGFWLKNKNANNPPKSSVQSVHFSPPATHFFSQKLNRLFKGNHFPGKTTDIFR
jgi:hypothetical protein